MSNPPKAKHHVDVLLFTLEQINQVPALGKAAINEL